MNETILNHDIKIIDRKSIELSGIKKILHFNAEEFFLDSCMGNIEIKGNQLEIIKLDITDGNVKIKGKINSIIYFDNTKRKDKENLLIKLFK